MCTTIIISFFTLCIFLVLYFFCTAHVYIPIWYFNFDSKNTYIFVRNKFQSNKLVNFYWSRALKSFNSSSVASGLKKFGRTSQVVHPNIFRPGSTGMQLYFHSSSAGKSREVAIDLRRVELQNLEKKKTCAFFSQLISNFYSITHSYRALYYAEFTHTAKSGLYPFS